MKRSELLIIALASVLLAIWGLIRYTDLQSELSAPINAQPKLAINIPAASTQIGPLVSPSKEDLLSISNEYVWGISPIIEPKKPDPNMIVYVPSTSGTPARICVGSACYLFMGLAERKALFYDLNDSVTQRSLALDVGTVLYKSLRIKSIAWNNVIIIDSKTRTTYEMPLFKVDTAKYAPKIDSKKGKI